MSEHVACGRPPEFLRSSGEGSPYGVYDVTQNRGWVSVGISSDTAAFFVSSIGRSWRNMGKMAYPRAKALLVTSDGGGSNGVRYRLWQWELQRLADRTGLTISVRHLPPATSKWNKIAHGEIHDGWNYTIRPRRTPKKKAGSKSKSKVKSRWVIMLRIPSSRHGRGSGPRSAGSQA